LEVLGVQENQLDSVYAVLDKRNKIPAEAFAEMLEKVIADADVRTKIIELMAVGSIEQLADFAGSDKDAIAAIAELKEVFDYLSLMGVADYCKFDIGIVRGLAYYTGIVFEVYDCQSKLRAICGGGRYDNLLADFGGQKVTATGFGMGDCVLGILLAEKGLIPDVKTLGTIDYFVACVDKDLRDKAVEIVAKLRLAGKSAEFSYKAGNLGKQMKQASSLNAAKCVIVGGELADSEQVSVKNMADGKQDMITVEELLKI